jgi:hypothetical protein
MTSDQATPSRSNIVPSGCVMIASLVIIAVAIAGYFGYRHFAGALDVPEELEPYKDRDSVDAMIRSDAPAPAPGTTLDTAWLAFYVDGIDATSAAFHSARGTLDSMYRAGRATGDTGIASMLTSPSFYRAVTLMEPLTKRALVEFLNARNRSLDEYAWAKLRVLAATDITRATVDSTMRAFMGRILGSSPENFSFSSRNSDTYFAGVDSLRRSGAITDDERALVAPVRSRILERGLASLYGFDVDFGE